MDNLRNHVHIQRPSDTRNRVDYTQRGVVDRRRARFYVSEEQRHIAAIGSEEERRQPNYFRLKAAEHHRLHDMFCRDLQRQEDVRYRKVVRNKFIEDRMKRPVIKVLCTTIFLSCLLFYGLQTLRGFLHWLFIDMLHLEWYDLPSRILLHVSWIPAWIVIMLLFTLTTLLDLYLIMISSKRHKVKSNLIAMVPLKFISLIAFVTLLLLYLTTVLPKRAGDPTWLQPEYIPWNVTTAPLLFLIFLPLLRT